LASDCHSDDAEFKVSVPRKVRELLEEVCAFASAAGGVLLKGCKPEARWVAPLVSLNKTKEKDKKEK
jgi:predicted HTH transcriptional regulator